MWMVILSTLAVAFASGLSMGSSLERGHWESAIKDQLNKLDARLARHARRVRSRRANNQRPAAAARFAPASRSVKHDAGRRKAANAA